VSRAERYADLFARHRSAAIRSLWPWQEEVLAAYGEVTGDAAVELPTGTGKTLIGLLAGEEFREATDRPVAYLAGNKQLAQQIERQARDLGFPVVRFQGKKESWDNKDVRKYHFARAIGVMNYWNYFNASPGVDPAGMLILDDVHLLEGPLRDYFTVFVEADTRTCNRILSRIVAQSPYYRLAEDLRHGVEPGRAPEMLVFPDSADLANEVRDLLDSRIEAYSDAWWAWVRIRDHLEVCCWLLSPRGITFTPYIPPAQTIDHFQEPERRLYLSATVGSVDDLQRRLGTPPFTKLTASAQPRQGERFVLMFNATKVFPASALVPALHPFLLKHHKALWLCARGDTATEYQEALSAAKMPGGVWRLESDNGADEPFAAAKSGHLVAAGRYDGMDFPGDTCRVEIVPEVPVATSDLEEFVSNYLRDAPFAEARFAQRVAQALGRCNRGEHDRALYVLTDPEFLARFSKPRILGSLPEDVAGDVYAALERADEPIVRGFQEADRFLAGEHYEAPPAPARRPADPPPSTAANEVKGFLMLWREDYGRAAAVFDRVAHTLSKTKEHRAFWLAMRALALHLAARYGDAPAAVEARAALRAAATAGAVSTFFTRLHMAEARLEGQATAASTDGHDELFAAWDRLIDRVGTQGPRFEQWADGLMDDLRGDKHDPVARAIATVGTTLLGLPADARQATSGEEDAYWELSSPRRVLSFEVKLAPKVQRVVNHDVDQAEGATHALGAEREVPARGLLITPHDDIDETAEARLDKVRVLNREVFAEQVDLLLDLLNDYRHGWSDDAGARAARRKAVEPSLPPLDWLWKAAKRSSVWVEPAALRKAWRAGVPA
jgi:hypothetical protein